MCAYVFPKLIASARNEPHHTFVMQFCFGVGDLNYSLMPQLNFNGDVVIPPLSLGHDAWLRDTWTMSILTYPNPNRSWIMSVKSPRYMHVLNIIHSTWHRYNSNEFFQLLQSVNHLNVEIPCQCRYSTIKIFHFNVNSHIGKGVFLIGKGPAGLTTYCTVCWSSHIVFNVWKWLYIILKHVMSMLRTN